MNRLWIAWLLVLSVVAAPTGAGQLGPKQQKLLAELRACPLKIACESFRGGNWELMVMNADGSEPRNITHTPDVDELFPHASPDGSKLVFVADEGRGTLRTRNAYCMSLDGTGRTKIGENARQPFWCPDGHTLGYLGGSRVDYTEGGRANRGLFFHDLRTGKTTRHPRADIASVLNPCTAPNGKWIVASAMGGLGFAHSIVAIEARGTRAVELARSRVEARNVYQCRPDLSPDGRRIAWAKQHHGKHVWAVVGDIDPDVPTPRVTRRRYVATVDFPAELAHVDWSPDGRFIAYSQGPMGGRMQPAPYVVGNRAKGWDIWVVKVAEPEVVVQLTLDGLSNKEPDWVPVAPR